MENRGRSKGIGFLLSLILLMAPAQVFAGWETGAKAGFDSNVDRAVNGGKSDAFLSGYLAYSRGPSGESRLDWTMAATLEGNAYAKISNLDYALLTLAPGLTFFPYLSWTINISPFVQGKAVKDDDQSAVAFGGKVSLRQQILKHLYTGQYYIYKDSRADLDVFSYTENAVGIYIGGNLPRSSFVEIGYEFSHGDSFRTISTTSTAVSGRGKKRQFSTAFSEDVIREKVDRHSIGVNAGIDWTKSLFSFVSYSYTILHGDLGTATPQTGYIGLGYRF